MKTSRALLIALLLLLLPYSVAEAASGEASPARLQTDIPKLMQAAEIPGLSIAVIRDGTLAWSGALGVLDSKTGAPVQPDTVFPAASLSKPVFASIVLRLAGRGVLDLDKPLWTYLPTERLQHDERGKRITARMVLSHTTGLPNWGPEKLPFNADPGERFGYSGEGYVYLQKVVEKLTGLPLQDLARKEVFEPLGMTRTSFAWEPSFAGGAVTGMDPFGRPQEIPQDRGANAAASLLTTAGDYARFLLALLDGRILPKETVDAMLSPQVRIPGELFDPKSPPGTGEVAWGLGWGLQRRGAGEPFWFWHWGDNGGFRAWITMSREARTGVVYFTNSAEGLSIAEAVAALAVGADQPAFGRLGYERYDAPQRVARKDIQRAFSNEGSEAGLRRYRELQAKSPDVFDTDLILNLAEFLRETGKAADAVAVLKLHVQSHPRSPEAHASLGDTALASGDYELALASFQEARKLAPKDQDRDREIRWAKEGVEALRKPVSLPAEILSRFAGKYGPRHITLEGGQLYYQREGRSKYKLLPLKEDTFLLDGLGSFRVRFVEEDGRVTKLVGLYSDGQEDESPRDL
jgi:CubicO group peptidase (beta-lactamase class C family)